MKISKTVFATISAVFFAQATAATVDDSPAQIQQADPTDVLSGLLHLMLDTLDKKNDSKKGKKKKDGNIDVIDGVTVHTKCSKNPYKLDPEEKDFITQALLTSYNQIHVGDDYDGKEMNFVSDGLDDNEEEDDVSAAATEDQALRRRSVPRPRSFRAWYRFSFNYSCRLCGDDALMTGTTNAAVTDPQAYLKQTEKHNEWETVFCGMLQESPLESLQDSDQCKIEMDHGINMKNALA